MMIIEDATLIGIVSAVTGCFVKIADIAYNYFIKEKKTKEVQDILDKINHLHNILSKTDEENIPLVYTSKRIIIQLENIKDLLKTINSNSLISNKSTDKLAEAMEQVIRILDKLDDRSQHRTK